MSINKIFTSAPQTLEATNLKNIIGDPVSQGYNNMKDTKDKEDRFIHPEEAALAAHHLKVTHNIKKDKALHKAAKDHIKNEHDALGEVIGKTVQTNPSNKAKTDTMKKPKTKATKAKGKK